MKEFATPMIIELLYLETNECSFAIIEVSVLSGSHTIASLSPTRVSTPEFLTETRRISLTTASFNERRGAFSSEGGGEFEFGAFVYLPTTSFFLGGVQLIH